MNDKEVFDILTAEEKRQHTTLRMVASTNQVSDNILRCLYK